MKLHLPVLLRKALLACFSFVFASSMGSGRAAAEDLTLGGDASLTIDYAAANSIPDLAGGTLQLSGDTVLLLSNCGVGDGKTYTLLTRVDALSDADGNPLTLTDENNTASLYFDTSRPGSGFWADGWLQLASDGSVQIVLHAEDVQSALTITTRQTGSKTYNYYKNIIFQNIASSTSSYAEGGAIRGYDATTLSNNGSVVFEGNTASSTFSYAYGGAICGSGVITLSNNGSVLFEGNTASSTSSSAEGGAIRGSSGVITLSNNGSVVFERNTASSSYARGGAIYGSGGITLSNNGSVVFSGNTASYGGGAIDEYYDAITLSNNGSVVFEGNTASSSTYIAWGGAIHGSGVITLSNNGSVVFERNTASSTSSYAEGGAIRGYNAITLSNNGSVVFEGNTASSSTDSASGGAISGHTITLSNNGSVVFEGNTASSSTDSARGGAISVSGESNELIITGNASGQNEDGSAQQLLFENNHTKGTGDLSGAYGGAICVGSGSTLKINNNGETIFRGNYASSTGSAAEGGAIYKMYGIFSIQNNASVVFEKNYTLQMGTLRLQSISAFDLGDAGDEMVVNFSAPKDGKIEFRDSILIKVNSNSASAFHLNNWYENDAGESQAQTGDIIFTGADATAENLNGILAVHGINRAATADEIRFSKTSDVLGTMQLHDGRLIVRDGAILRATGITVHGSASGESTPTLWLDNGELTSLDNFCNALSFASGTSFALSGQNVARNSAITFAKDSTFIITLDAMHAVTAALTLTNSTLSLPTSGMLTLQLNAAEGLATDGRYILLSGVAQPSNWANVTVTGGVWDKDALSWVGDTLYLNYPTLTEATWNNASGDWAWNVESSVNWEQHELNWAYRNGIGVIFGDEACGTVKLVGNLAPKSVLVNNSIGKDYVFSGTGSLTDSMKLTKEGTGKLTIQTANSYTGGTEIKGGVLVVDNTKALGTGDVVLNGGTLEIAVTGVGNTIANTGTSTLKVANGRTHGLTGTIANSGELTLSGSFDASSLSKSDSVDVYVDVAGNETVDGSGFTRSGDFTVTIANGTVDSTGAIVSYKGTTLVMTGGVGLSKGGMLWGEYRILTGHEVELSAIVNKAAENQVSTTNIQLNGGKLTANTALTGTLSISGTSTLHGVDFNLGNAPLQNSGDLTLTGSFDASALAKSESDDIYVALNGTEEKNGSGFLREGDFEVIVVAGSGSVDSSGVTEMKYGTQNLTMTGGIGTGVGEMQYDTYRILSGHTASSTAIHAYDAGKGKNALITLVSGGTLNADDAVTETKVSTTGGSINLSAGTLSGTVGGSTIVTVSGTATMSGDNSYTGGTTLNSAALTVTHANALGTGGINTTGESSLSVGDVTLVLGDSIANTGELTLSGSFDASGLTLNRTEEGRLGLDGTKVSLAESGFARGVEYSVQIVEGGTTVNDGASISHKDYLSRNALVLGADGVARAGGAVDYTHFFLTGGDSAVVSEIADVSKLHQETLAGVTMDSGSLEVDQSIAVNATGGSIHITDDAVLSGTVEDTAVSTAADDYSSEIAALLKGDTTLEVNGGAVTVSGDNSYSGGTVVNGGSLLAGHDKAFGTGDVAVNGATLDLNRFSIANKVRLNGNSTLGHADGAAHIVLGGGSKVNFRDGYTLSAGKVLEVASPGATYTGALTLGGGTLELDGLLTVQGDVTFESGTQTTIDISGWNGADDGEVLATLGSSNSGYTEESLKLAGIAGDWELDFDAATGVLTLVAVKDEPLPEPEFNPNLNRNQQIVYDTIKDIMGEGNPGGLLGELGKEVTGTRDEEKLKQLLDELGGAEYATLLSGQQAAARGHMRRLRGEMGSGHLLAGSKTRAYIEAYNHRSEVDGDAHGRGYELNESGGQFALEFLGEDSVSGGFAVAAGRSKLQPDGGMTQKSDNTYVDAFLLHRDGAYTGKFSLGVGVHKYDLDRRVAGNAVSADTSGSSVNFMHESAWAMSLSESHSVQVFGAVESSFNRLGAFHEEGADTASLQVESQDAWVTTLSLGARYLYSFAALESAPAATLSLQGGLELDFGDTDIEVEMNFEGARSHRFRQSGAERDTFGYNLGASLHLPVSAKAAIYASGDAVLRGDSYEVNANVGLQMAF